MIKLIYEYNALDYYYEYISGFRNIFNFQYVMSKGNTLPDFPFGGMIFCISIGSKGNWANRIRVGFASNEESPFAPFSVDNNLNIRGVGNVIDRGTGVVVINTEYRHQLYKET